METEKREVNLNETEVINADAIPDKEEAESLDEEVIPPTEEAEVKPEKKVETKVKPIVDASESFPDEVKAEPVKAEEAVPSQPKPVEGETPREFALRKEVEHLRIRIRQKRTDDVISMIPKQVVKDDEEYAKLKETYNETELSNLEKLVDVVARKKGYVRQEEAQKQTINQVLKKFTDEHEEYLPENDSDDIRWKFFEGRLMKFYRTALSEANSSDEIAEIYRLAHRDTQDRFGETKTKVEPKPDPGKAEAQRQKIQSASHAGGTNSAPPPKISSIDPSVRGLFKGFDDTDFE